jgi:uncharacterized protein YndB with AHSA1/START domain
MLLIYGDERALDETEREECYRESTQLAREIDSAGQYLAAAPLHPTATAASIRVRKGKRLVTDGPFAETREQLGGYFLVDVRDLDEAIDIAARIPMARQGTVEVRPVVEIAGLPTGRGTGGVAGGTHGAQPGSRRSSAPTTTSTPVSAGRELVIMRIVDAPRTRVFRAWTAPEQVARWWGPHGFTNPVCELDARPGGAIRIHMRGPDGTLYPMTGAYQEIVESERLVLASAALDDGGNPLFEVLSTVTFGARNGKTVLTLRARVARSTAAAAPYLEGMEAGWTQSLERLAAHVAAWRGVTDGTSRQAERRGDR